MNAETKCPMDGGQLDGPAVLFEMTNRLWWPNHLDLTVLHQNPPALDPMGAEYDYRAEFKTLDLAAVKADIVALLTDSQAWWPADYGNYGPFFVRMAWHAAGTYRIGDGRGGAGAGQQRFAPLNSWPDNANLDKARLLLWPIKSKYGRKLSWADLLVLAGNCAIESMGCPTAGFGGGREDVWEPENDVNWGPEREWLSGKSRYTGKRELAKPLGAVQMGLIYVNPEGPEGSGDPVAAAHDIRETFGRMAMNDTETVALIAGGHTFGKTHGAAVPDDYVGAEPEGAPIEMQGLGWKNSFGDGTGVHTITSGLEGAWTQEPTKWTNLYFKNIFEFDWEMTRSPAGAKQWKPTNPEAQGTVPDAHDATRRHAPTMLTTDLALIKDPAYLPISRGFYEHPETLAGAFAEAWYKLTHRDMGPHELLLGAEVPAEPRIWQDPLPAATAPVLGDADIAALKAKIMASGLSIGRLVATAWASASTFRGTDKRGGANGARIALAPQKDWAVNEPTELATVLAKLDELRVGTTVSLADMIVLGGTAAVEAAAKAAGHDIVVPFSPGRVDATDAMTDAESFAPLEATVDGFRNYDTTGGVGWSIEERLIDRAHLLTLSAPEMTVLIGGLRVLGANVGGSTHGVFTDRVGVLTNDFFVNLLNGSMTLSWTASNGDSEFVGKDRATGATIYTGTRADLIFGSNSQLRAISEVFAADDAKGPFVTAFVKAWTKVMNLDRFDLK